MSMQDGQVVTSKVANAMIPGAKFAGFRWLRWLPIVSANRRGMQDGETELEGPWVGGRVSLTRDTVEFHPNGMNRTLNVGTLDRSFLLKEITNVKVRKAFFTDIIEFSGKDGSSLEVRCYGAEMFADQVCRAMKI